MAQQLRIQSGERRRTEDRTGCERGRDLRGQGNANRATVAAPLRNGSRRGERFHPVAGVGTARWGGRTSARRTDRPSCTRLRSRRHRRSMGAPVASSPIALPASGRLAANRTRRPCYRSPPARAKAGRRGPAGRDRGGHTFCIASRSADRYRTSATGSSGSQGGTGRRHGPGREPVVHRFWGQHRFEPGAAIAACHRPSPRLGRRQRGARPSKGVRGRQRGPGGRVSPFQA